MRHRKEKNKISFLCCVRLRKAVELVVFRADELLSVVHGKGEKDILEMISHS